MHHKNGCIKYSTLGLTGLNQYLLLLGNSVGKFHPSIQSLPVILISVMGGLEPIQGTIGREAGYSLERLPVCLVTYFSVRFCCC